MESSFKEDDVTLLLKDISGLVKPLPTEEREKKIQSGVHYSEMLPLEYRPTDAYIEIYEKMIDVFGQSTADAVSRVSDKIVSKKGKDVVIVSLARAGTPLGVLIRRFIRKKYGYECPHYSISIIRDRGIDKKAIEYILDRHNAGCIQFIDGWTGKGTILKELNNALTEYKGISKSLAVIADPAGLTDLCGTHDDILIPSSCLNSTVCGLISRTFFREDIIGKDDFHGAAYYRELSDEDRTYEFIDSVERLFKYDLPKNEDSVIESGTADVKMLSYRFGIDNINYIKPGIGESTRVLLRRVPWKVVINEKNQNDIELDHIKQLSSEKGVEIIYEHMNNYKCCGLIKKLSDV